jgi:polysaccharide deacetylase 2 family uncharacterized protein YibQ
MFDVICNNNDVKDLTIGKKYTVVSEMWSSERDTDRLYIIINDFGLKEKYTSKRFVSLLEGRNIKINSIIND